MNLREAAEKALETLEYLAQREHPQTNIVTKTHRIFPHRMMTEAAKELRAALAKPARKPACIFPQCVSTTRTQCEAWALGACEERQA